MRLETDDYGFKWLGLLRVMRIASSQPGERRRYAVVRVFCANGDIVEVTATPRTTTVRTFRKDAKGNEVEVTR